MRQRILFRLLAGGLFLLSTLSRPATAETSCLGTSLVLLVGDDLSALSGTNVDALRVITFQRGHFVPVPFQLDERDDDGTWLLPIVHEGDSWREVYPNPTQRRLTRGDELLFPIESLGTSSSAPPTGSWISVKVSTGTQPPRFAWVGTGGPVSGRSPEDLVGFDQEHLRVITDRYVLGYDELHPGLPVEYRLVHPRTGCPSPDLLQSVNLDIHLSLLFGGIAISRNAGDLIYHLLAYHDGPLRVVLRESYSVKIAPGISSPSLEVTRYAYRRSFEIPALIHVPFSPALVLTTAQVRASIRLEGQVTPWIAREENPAPAVALETLPPPSVFSFATSTRVLLHQEAFGTFSISVGFPRRAFADMDIGLRSLLIPSQVPLSTGSQFAQQLEVGFEADAVERLSRGSYPVSMRVSVEDTCGATAPPASSVRIEVAGVKVNR